MTKTRAVQVRITRRQYEQIHENALRHGFASLSAYVRYVALHYNDTVEQKLIEIHRHLLAGSSQSTRRKHDGTNQ